MARISRLVRGVRSVVVGRPGRDGGARGVGRAPRAQWGLSASKTTRPRENRTERSSSLPSSLAHADLGVRGPAVIRAGSQDCPQPLC